MKFSTAFFTVCCVVAAQKTLEDVYGPVQPVTQMVSKTAKAPRTRAAENLFQRRRMVDFCDFPFEILLVQDSTDSFSDDYEQMRDVQLDLMFDALSKVHPDTRYGMLSFRDKPIMPWGIAKTPENGGYEDYCVELEADFSPKVDDLREAFEKRKPNGGADPSESQFTALMAATQSKFFSWDPNGYSTKLVVLVTDAPPHFDGDEQQELWKGQQFSGRFDDANPSEQCTAEYYPTPAQVAHALDGQYAYLATLVYDPEYMNGLPYRSWDWFNKYYGQTDAFLNPNAKDSSDFWTNLASTIKAIEDLECVYPSTTEAPVESTSTSTTASTTTESTVSEQISTAVVGTPLTQTTSEGSSSVMVGTPLPQTTTTGDHECPPCPPAEECPPCMTPPPRPDECEETVICEEGVYINIGFKPDHWDLKVDGKDVPLPAAEEADVVAAEDESD